MERYQIHIIADKPPDIKIGDYIAGGNVTAIQSSEPDQVSAKWLSDKTGLSRATIINTLRGIAGGTVGKNTYPRLLALDMLSKTTVQPRGRPRKR